MTALAIDVGQTGIRLYRPRVPGAAVRTSPFAARHLRTPGEPARLAGELVRLVTALAVPGGQTLRVAVSVTGFSPDGALEMLHLLSDSLPLGGAVAADDAVATHVGAHGLDHGVTVVAGTGLVAVSASPSGVRTLGGHGWLTGDVGGGFWIGANGLLEALRHEDGTGGSEVLWDLARVAFGEPLRGAVADLYAGASPIHQVAGFAPSVAAAARLGDERSLLIWQRAVAEARALIVGAAADLTRVAGAVKVCIAGGLAKETSLYLTPLLESLPMSFERVDTDLVRGLGELPDLVGTHRFDSYLVQVRAACSGNN